MVASNLRRVLLTSMVPLTVLAMSVSLGATSVLAQTSGGGTNTLSNQMPAVSPSMSGPAPTATGKNTTPKRATRVRARIIRPRHSTENKTAMEHK